MTGARATITSTRNRRVVEARKLSQRKHRQSQGAFLVEGLQALHMAADASWEPIEAFYSSNLLIGDEGPALLERFRAAGAEVVPVSPRVLQVLSERDTPQGLVVTFRLRTTPLEQLHVPEDGLVVVLDRLRDPGNLGTIVRTADAVGASAVVVIAPSADPFDPKAVRSSMGSLFNLPLVLVKEVPTLLAQLQRTEAAATGLRLVGADPGGVTPWESHVWSKGVALVLGNEGEGLSADVRRSLDLAVGLPMVGHAESLNVAVAGGVLMYMWWQAHHPQ
jgi:TrmH family RNA methyltransferase